MHIDFLRGSDICLDKKIFTFNEKSTENWFLPSENRLWNQFCHRDWYKKKCIGQILKRMEE